MTTVEASSGVVVARPKEQRQAHELLDELAGRPDKFMVESADRRSAAIPSELAKIISQVLAVMAAGGSVTVGVLPEELTTTVAAGELGVSRTTLMKMIRNGEIEAHRVGSHHRLKTADVLAFKKARLQHQRQALTELRDLEEELDAF